MYDREEVTKAASALLRKAEAKGVDPWDLVVKLIHKAQGEGNYKVTDRATFEVALAVASLAGLEIRVRRAWCGHWCYRYDVAGTVAIE